VSGNGSGRLADRVYIVTGAAGGIGQATVRVLLDEGARVVLTDIDQPRTDAAANAIDPEGTRTHSVAADLVDAASVEPVVAGALERFGRLDGCVNAAGHIVMDTAWDATAEEWQKHFAVNATASFAMCRAVGNHLRTSGGGSIVNISSSCGKVGYDNMAAYNASKAAVISLTRSLSAEWASDRITVNAVCPGGVDTPMLTLVADWISPRVGVPSDELLKGMGPPQLGRRVEPMEVARVIAFLLTDDAKIIRGQAINIDAGETPY
jgi:NAD(P)-dependent dehydrogenase (short-subunit alcohol dehydrogenase family)